MGQSREPIYTRLLAAAQTAELPTGRLIAEHEHEEGVSTRNLVNDRALNGSQQALLIKLTADAGEIVLVVRQNGQSTFRFISESH